MCTVTFCRVASGPTHCKALPSSRSDPALRAVQAWPGNKKVSLGDAEVSWNTTPKYNFLVAIRFGPQGKIGKLPRDRILEISNTRDSSDGDGVSRSSPGFAAQCCSGPAVSNERCCEDDENAEKITLETSLLFYAVFNQQRSTLCKHTSLQMQNTWLHSDARIVPIHSFGSTVVAWCHGLTRSDARQFPLSSCSGSTALEKILRVDRFQSTIGHLRPLDRPPWQFFAQRGSKSHLSFAIQSASMRAKLLERRLAMSTTRKFRCIGLV